MMQIHEKIEQARVSAGLTQEQMAEKLGIKRSTYQYWEEKTPGIDKVKGVAKALNLPEDYFFSDIDEKTVATETQDATIDKDPDRSSRESLVRSIENLTANELRLTSVIEQMVAMMREQFSSGKGNLNPSPPYQPGTNVGPDHPGQQVDLSGKSEKAGR